MLAPHRASPSRLMASVVYICSMIQLAATEAQILEAGLPVNASPRACRRATMVRKAPEPLVCEATVRFAEIMPTIGPFLRFSFSAVDRHDLGALHGQSWLSAAGRLFILLLRVFGHRDSPLLCLPAEELKPGPAQGCH